MSTDYTVKLHQNGTMNFKWDKNRPIVKRIFEETYILPKELVAEQVHEMLDIPFKRIKDPRDLDPSLRACMTDKEEKEFIENNNRLLDLWETVKPQIEEWIALHGERPGAVFKHFTIDLEKYSWNNHELDTADDLDKSYIDISAI